MRAHQAHVRPTECALPGLTSALPVTVTPAAVNARSVVEVNMDDLLEYVTLATGAIVTRSVRYENSDGSANDVSLLKLLLLKLLILSILCDFRIIS